MHKADSGCVRKTDLYVLRQDMNTDLLFIRTAISRLIVSSLCALVSLKAPQKLEEVVCSAQRRRKFQVVLAFILIVTFSYSAHATDTSQMWKVSDLLKNRGNLIALRNDSGEIVKKVSRGQLRV